MSLVVSATLPPFTTPAVACIRYSDIAVPVAQACVSLVVSPFTATLPPFTPPSVACIWYMKPCSTLCEEWQCRVWYILTVCLPTLNPRQVLFFSCCYSDVSFVSVFVFLFLYHPTYLTTQSRFPRPPHIASRWTCLSVACIRYSDIAVPRCSGLCSTRRLPPSFIVPRHLPIIIRLSTTLPSYSW